MTLTGKIELQGFADTINLNQIRPLATIRTLYNLYYLGRNKPRSLCLHSSRPARELPLAAFRSCNIRLYTYLIRGVHGRASSRHLDQALRNDWHYRPCHRYSQFGGRATVSTSSILRSHRTAYRLLEHRSYLTCSALYAHDPVLAESHLRGLARLRRGVRWRWDQ